MGSPGSLLAVHSPLVGPSSWARVGAAARRAGWHVVGPDLTGVAARTDSWSRWFVDTAVGATGDAGARIVVVGHSGAGVFLPQIADRLGARHRATVFVDAVVPPAEGTHHTSAELVAKLDAETEDGMLRPWLDWWPDEVVARILPDPVDRAEVAGDMPRLPRAFYDEEIPVPAGWSDGPNGYVQLSPAYQADRQRAAGLGWPVETLDGTHLSVVTAPADVFDRILAVVAALAP